MNKLIIILMFTLQSEITIGDYVSKEVNDIVIKESWRTIGDTATIKLPKLAMQLEREISVGDPVIIKLGYKDVHFEEEFVGFVSKISPNLPYVIECEDYIFHAKRTNLKELFKATTLKEVVEFIAEQINKQRELTNENAVTINSNIPTIDFDKFRLNNVSAAGALKKIKKEYGLTAYFKGTELFVGLPYTDLNQAGEVVNYSTSWNIIKSNLEFVKAEDKAIKIKAISVLKDNMKLEVEVGDRDGEQRTLFFYKIKTEAKLEELALAKLDTLKYSGFKGDFKTFFIPYAQHSMVANIKDPEYNEGRAGNYLIDSVTKEFGQNGARRKIELGIQL